jgi:hypothetical protein
VTLTGVGAAAFFRLMRRPTLLRRVCEGQFRFYRPIVGKRDFEAFCRRNSQLLLAFALIAGLFVVAGLVQLLRAW